MSNALPVPARANQRNNRNSNIVVSQNNGLPANINQGNNIVQNINQNTVSNNVAQQIVQQSNNNSANVGDGLPSVPNQNNGSSTPEPMSQWFISHMKGEGELTPWGAIPIDGSEEYPPASGYGWFTKIPDEHWAMTGQNHLARVRADVPNYGRHGHPDFDGDWVRWPRDSRDWAVPNEQGAYYRPTSMNNWR